MNLIAMLMVAVAPVEDRPLPDVLLVDFYAGYCQPCQQMVPILQEMARDKYPIQKIDIQERPDVSRQYGVTRIPTLVLLVEGREVKRFTGFTSGETLRSAMQQAARDLDEKRAASRAPGARETAPQQPLSAPPEDDSLARAATPAAEEGPGGIRGLFDRMKRGLGGGPADAESGPADYRGQSPDADAPTRTADSAMASTVRVRLIDGNMRDFGTGTIVHSTEGESTILTCAHIFKGVSGKAAVVVDVFRDGEVLKYPASVVGGDHNSDVAFLTIRNARPLPTSKIAPQLLLRPQDPVFSIGCNNGDLPTRLNMNVVEVNRYEGPENVVCTLDPVQGRSGGGLFNTSGELVGVCSGAFRQEKEGLYSGVKPVLALAQRSELNYLLNSPAPAIDNPSTETLMADAANPFAEDDAMLEEMMGEATPGFAGFEDAAATGLAATAPEAFADSSLSGRALTDRALPDPFATAAVPAAVAAPPTEVTVIIDSQDPSQGKRVIVIPRPSPWLLELLTGEPGGVRPAGRGAVTATSARRTVAQLSRPVYRFQVR